MSDTADSANILEKPSSNNIIVTQLPSDEQVNQQDRRSDRIEATLEKVANLLEALTLNQYALAQNQTALIQRQVYLTKTFNQIAQTLSEVKAGQEHQDRVIDYLLGKHSFQITDKQGEAE